MSERHSSPLGISGEGHPVELSDLVLAGDRIALARLISRIENRDMGYETEVERLFPHTGRAHIVGITGPPGSGKSTLAARLAKEFRSRGSSVAILAIDPTSPFSGGAVLGDRVRMHGLAGDKGVFIRSMASRGAQGGLAMAAGDAIRVMDAAGFQVIIVETVGAGQGEVDVVRAARSVVLVEVPGLGDEVQSLKAGILEIADLLVVNKADRDGADRVVRALQGMLDMDLNPKPWRPPILKTVATLAKGVAELATALEEHGDYLETSGELQQRMKATSQREVIEAAKEEFIDALWSGMDEAARTEILHSVLEKEKDPRSAARELVKRFVGSAAFPVAHPDGSGVS